MHKPKAQATIPSHMQYLRPLVVSDLKRFGRPNDGGYILPESIVLGADALISFGIGDDCSFEDAFGTAAPDCPIHAYDYFANPEFNKGTVLWGLKGLLLRREGALKDLVSRYRMGRVFKKLFSKPSNQFFRRRVYNRIDEHCDVTPEQVVGKLPASNSIVLKMDIEGGEYRIAGQLMEYVDRIAAIVVEFHDTDPLRTVFNSTVQMLLERYHIVHLHANNSSGIADDGVPEVLELSLIRKDLFDGPMVYRDRLPIAGLDQPNIPKRDDYRVQFSD
jgi:hypothetical protein